MREIIPDVFTWAWFSQPHGYNFNGHLVRHPAGNLLIDPVAPGDAELDELTRSGAAIIVLTNRNHSRAANLLRSRTGARTLIHPGDAPHARAQGTEIDGSLVIGETVGPLRVVDASGKSPGEIALHWPERGVLVVGDAVIGNPPGSGALPRAKVVDDLPRLRRNVARLLDLDFDTLLVGDGVPILSGAKRRLQELTDSFPNSFPAQRRKLGRTGFTVAPLALGGNVFGWTADEAMSFRLLDAFVGAGFNLVDTADSYSRWVPGHQGGESETVIGRWIARRGRHDDVVIATKVGSDMGLGYRCLKHDYIIQAVEQSLKRLQVDAIDLYQSHWDDEKTLFDDTLEAYARLIEQGKVRAIGASNLTPPRFAQALEVASRAGLPRYLTLQPQYNLYDRSDFEGPLAELCIREGLGVMCYFALAAGFLTGKYRSEADYAKSPRGPGMKKYLNPRGLRILDALDRVAHRVEATPAQVALAWLMARPGVTAPIASATSVAQLEDLLAATRLVLDGDAMGTLDAASA